MKALSFDTSRPEIALALLQDGKILAERTIVPVEPSRQESVSKLMPGIDEIVAGCNWSAADLDLLIVGTGPGSFTGIRIAVVTARVLAQSMGVGLVGVDALRSYAQLLQKNEGALGKATAIVLSGGRGHFFAAVYEQASASDGIKCTTVPSYLNTEQLGDLLSVSPRCFLEQKVLDELCLDRQKCGTLPSSINLAALQAEVIGDQLAGKATDRESLKRRYHYREVEPLYLRGASVTIKSAS